MVTELFIETPKRHFSVDTCSLFRSKAAIFGRLLIQSSEVIHVNILMVMEPVMKNC